MTQLPNAFAWQVVDKWYYAETREAGLPIAVEVERYDSDGRIVLYWPLRDSGTIIWNAVQVE
jgi:hypothetical protein